MPSKKNSAEALKKRAEEHESWVKVHHLETLIPQKTFYTAWVETLGELELRVLGMCRELIKALDGQSEADFFELIATLNTLLDITEKLHTRVAGLERQTSFVFRGQHYSVKGRFQIPLSMIRNELPLDLPTPNLAKRNGHKTPSP